MTTLGWWMLWSPIVVMLTGVAVMRAHGRYRGRHVRDAGVDIFLPWT